MSGYIKADALIADMQERYCKPCKEKGEDYNEVRCRACWVDDAIGDVDGFADNSIDIVRCKECKHRPIKEDADGENYGFNLIEPNDGDERCPCLVSDGWYSWMPEDDFYCGYGEREGE